MKQPINKQFLYFLLPAFLISACSPRESASPVRMDIEEAVFASGHIEQQNQYTVSATVEGILTSVPVKEGDCVKENQQIAFIKNELQNSQLQDALVIHYDAMNSASTNAPQLQQMQTQIDQAENQFELDHENYKRYQDLHNKNSVSQLEFEKVQLQYNASKNHLQVLQKNYTELEEKLRLNEKRSRIQVDAERSRLGDFQPTSSFPGKVIRVFKKQGELVRKGEAIAEIGSGEYLIKLYVSEEDIVKIDMGQAVVVKINTFPTKTFKADVTKIYPAFDNVEQSYVLEAQFEELPDKMFSGTKLQANIETAKRKDVLVIPTSYIFKSNYVELKDGEQRKIITGSKNSDWTEVISGIAENEVIVQPEI